MEQELKFGHDLGRLAVLKKGFGPIMYEQHFMVNFHVFHAKKNVIFFKHIVASALKSFIDKKF